MSATPSSPAATGTTATPAGTLRSGALDLRHAVVISVAVMSPAASIFFNTPPQAQYVGAALPLCYVVGFVAALFAANQYSELSREMPSSGSAYTYVSESIGPRWGFLTGWIGLIAVALGAPYTLVVMSNAMESLVHRWLGLNVHWSVYIIAATGIVFAIAYVGVRESLRVDMLFLAFELVVCLALAAIVLLHVGQQGGLTAAPFTAAGVPKGGDLTIGIVLAVLSFMGFETAATLGEETTRPHRNIPRAVYGSMLVVGVFYVLMAYVGTIGYGPDHMVAGYGNDQNPFDTIARQFGGPALTVLIDLVGIVSCFAAALAIVNGGARILYAVGRDGLLPRQLGWTHPIRQTPGVAIALLCAIGLVAGIAVRFAMAPIDAIGFLGTLDALFIILIYILVNVACVRFFWRKRRAQFNIFRHVVFPVVSTLIVGTIFVAAVTSPGSGPLSFIPYVVAVWLALGVVLLLMMRSKITTA
ncbi:MAG: APC family permease [Ktedonobacterales bacterium]